MFFPSPKALTITAIVSAVGLSLVPGAPVDYARDIQPIFAEHCLECHGPDDAKAGLTLTSRELATKILKSGCQAVTPGNPEKSELVTRVNSSDPDEQMPPPKHRAKKAITTRDIELLRTWIAEGAKYDLHWAYKPVVQPAVPGQSKDTRQTSAIDAFIQAKLVEKNITPAPEADRVTLIRRVYYDLLGLPPSIAEVDGFLADISPNAYEAMLDRALASQHYGERWGRHWLDMARYADSDGYEKDRARPDAWRYRDWVIRALNEDLPFDQFTIEQLAGDLLPDATPEQVVATAFNRQTLTNTEGGTDQEQFRVEACMDRTETVGAVWLGLTVGCARCHTHKYDQITQREYYQLFAFFNNGDEVSRQVPTNPEEWSKYERQNGKEAKKLIPLQKALDEAKAALPVSLPEWEKDVQARLAKARAAKLTQSFKPLKIQSVASKAGATFKALPDNSQLVSGKQGKIDSYAIELAPANQPITALQIEVLTDDSLPQKGPGRSEGGNFVLSEVSVTSGSTPVILHSPRADFEQKDYKAAMVLDGNAATGWGIKGGIAKPHQLTLQLAHPLPPGSPLRIQLDQNYGKADHYIGRFRISAAAEETEASIAPPDVVKILNEEPRRRNPVVIKSLYDWLEKTDMDVMTAAATLKAAEARLPKAPLMDVRVIAQRSKEARTTHLLYRGDFLQPAEPVVPASLAVLPPMKVTNRSQATRLDLAKWLVSKDNPLTPRVTVNHIWGKLFGEGLVKTAADFGVRGDRPTHPELLDWLASELVKQGWRRKKLLKTIMMSATYRQSSSRLLVLGSNQPRSAAELARIQEIDPRNELLWRQNRLRVEGEVIRDLCLSASGLLSPKVGGPSVFPPMPPEIAALSYAGNFSWSTSKADDRFRRGLYTFFKRTAPYPDLVTFDCPDSNTANVKRTVSNTPLQALTTLNAEAFNETAQALAKRLLVETEKAAGSDQARLTHAFRLCLSRKPAAKELAALTELLGAARNQYKFDTNAARTLVGSYAVQDVPAAESAAWIATTRIILNMDEFITRE